MIKISEIRPNIYRLNFKNSYDMAMHFLRYQEYYESPKFRKKQFTIFEFMEWYSDKYGNGKFTYPTDWGGFNLPGSVIREVHDLQIIDYNQYDKNMFSAYKECYKKSGPNFYILSSNDDEIIIKHEIAHAFFGLYPTYTIDATALVNKLTPAFRNAMFDELSELGYDSSVFIDETQAYLATGIIDDSEVKLNGEDLPFIDLFNMHYKGIL